jgi:cystathionine beta-lyase
MAYNRKGKICIHWFVSYIEVKKELRYNFDQVLHRKGSNSYKWDQVEKLFGDSDILPLWVADMDFESPPAVKNALLERAQHGVYGYTIKSETFLRSITDWFYRRHHWNINPLTVSDSPGIVTSLSLAVECFSNPGDSVIIQTPVYYPFYDVIQMNNRQVARNPLIYRNGTYEMDYDHLEELMNQGAKLMLLCSPHNPGGRVWKLEELRKLGELALQYQVMIISDEIHCDLVLPGHIHTPFASISENFAQQSMTLLAPTKTFNIPGLQISFVVTPNMQHKRKFDQRIKSLSLHMTHFFSNEIVHAAYHRSEDWLDELLIYIQGNIDYACMTISQQLPAVKVIRPEATYLLWIDCQNFGLNTTEIKHLMFKEAKVAFSEGSVFGAEGEGFLRINVACPRALLIEALERFIGAINAK